MATSLQEYLRTSYRPDCEYVDGTVLERNVGLYDHSRLQGATGYYYNERRKDWGTQPLFAQRIQLSATRVRVPDVCVIIEEPREQVFSTAPLIFIEVLSQDDRFSEMQDRIHDYLNFGVRYVWILDPARRKAWRCTSDGMHEVSELRTETPETLVPLAALFE